MVFLQLFLPFASGGVSGGMLVFSNEPGYPSLPLGSLL